MSGSSSARQDHVPGSKGLDFAARIMERYGYKQGSGLGKAEQGMSTALQVEKTGARLGKIVHEKDVIREEMPNETVEYTDPSQAPTAVASAATQEAPPPIENVTTLLKSPTKVMLLRNMVGAGDVDADLQPEVQEEMAKYGDVQKCLVFEIPNAVSWDAVRIFIEFAKVEQAIKVSDFGVRGVAVEEVYDLHSPMNRRAYGFVFLFKWLENDRRNRHESIASANGIYASRPKAPKDMFFAKQIVENACATYALLNILLNCEHVELGPILEDLKELTKGMDASEKGQAISEIAEISNAHNSHARQECASLLCAPRKKRRSSSYQAAFVKVDSFHFSSFIYSKGHVYELDGLRDEPLDLGAVPAEVHWTEHFQRLIIGRVFDGHSTSQQEIRYSLMAVIPCPLYEAQRRLKELEEKLQLLRQELEAETARLTPKTRSSTASISKGLGRFLNFLESSSTPLRLRRCACKQTCLKSPPISRLDESSRQEEISLDYQIAMAELLTPVLPHAERNKICIPRTVALIRYAQAEIERLRSSVAELQQRRNQYIIDDERRVHDYEPFIRTFLLRLVDLERREKCR
ncbi:ubiquitin carboxyl terminal hydrolase BAP1 [Trichuris trichiura]|uniref:ubiquitinyl hydrolase 1 n=1 Tax=Trichuris trichiura TaxID=36087 RepID=A0A077Z0W8_TRITR|nr:ubiquitin carboxyl terminal hydrolase BAP1 [Trichuris trichiura]